MAMKMKVKANNSVDGNNAQNRSKETSSSIIGSMVGGKKKDDLVLALEMIDKVEIPKKELEKYSEVVVQDFDDGYHISKENEEKWKETHEFLYEYNQRLRVCTDIVYFVETFRIGMAAVYEYYKTVPIIAPDPEKVTLRWIKGDKTVDGPWRPEYSGRNETRMTFKKIIPYITDCTRDLTELKRRMNPSLFELEEQANSEFYQYIDNGQVVPDEYYRKHLMSEMAEKVIEMNHYNNATDEERAEIDRKREQEKYEMMQSREYDEKALRKLMKGKSKPRAVIDEDEVMDKLRKSRPELFKFMTAGKRTTLADRSGYRDEIRRTMAMLKEGRGFGPARTNVFATMRDVDLYAYAARLVQCNRENPRPTFNGDLLGKGYKKWESEMEDWENAFQLYKVGVGPRGTRYVSELEAVHENAMDMYEENGWNVRDWYWGKMKQNNIKKKGKKPWKDKRTWKSEIMTARARVTKFRRELYEPDWYNKLSKEEFDRITAFYNNVDLALNQFDEMEKPGRKDYERLRHLIEIPSVEMIATGADREQAREYAIKAASARTTKPSQYHGFADDKDAKKKRKASKKKAMERYENNRRRNSGYHDIDDDSVSRAEVYCKDDGSIGYISDKEGKKLLKEYESDGSATFGVSDDDMRQGESMIREDMDRYSRLLGDTISDRMTDDDAFDF